MKIFLLLLIIGGLVLLPFVALKRPWAVRLWQRVKLVVLIYALVVVAAAVYGLIFRWDDFYG